MRIAICLMAGLFALSVVASSAGQQQTGSVSGQVIAKRGGETVDLFGYSVFVTPTDRPQPLAIGEIADDIVSTDHGGNFRVEGLQPGDYFIFPDRALAELGTIIGLADSVTLSEGSLVETRPALRVTLAAGQDLAGIEFFIAVPEQCLFDAPCPLSPPLSAAPVVSPDSGSGANIEGNPSGYIGAAIAAAALVLLGGGVALRVRQRRRA